MLTRKKKTREKKFHILIASNLHAECVCTPLKGAVDPIADMSSRFIRRFNYCLVFFFVVVIFTSADTRCSFRCATKLSLKHPKPTWTNSNRFRYFVYHVKLNECRLFSLANGFHGMAFGMHISIDELKVFNCRVFTRISRKKMELNCK